MNNDNDFNNDDNSNPIGSSNVGRSLLKKIPRKARIVMSIILVTVAAVYLLNVFKPEADKRPIPETVVRVDVIQASKSSYPIVVSANGTVEAETRGNLVAQIRGEIVGMADNFKTGGTFQKGDVLIQIDQRDYQAELSRATASYSQADASYRQEKANAKQAEEDWKRLGNTQPAPDLVRRKPQLEAARAQLDSAKAARETAQLNLTRTQITAPYTGRIIRRDAVLGQYVSVGTPIAEVYSTDGVEVRLPISQDEFSQLGLDRMSTTDEVGMDFDVVLSSSVAGNDFQWQAKITRTDSTFDINTRQIDVIAEVIDPFGKISGQAPLKIGQFVNARIQGRTVENVFVIPNKSVREGSYSYVVRAGRLAKQQVDIVWQDDQNTLVSKGITEGDLVVTTSLNSTLAGAKAKLPEEFMAGKTEAQSLLSSADETATDQGSEVSTDSGVDSVSPELPETDSTESPTTETASLSAYVVEGQNIEEQDSEISDTPDSAAN